MGAASGAGRVGGHSGPAFACEQIEPGPTLAAPQADTALALAWEVPPPPRMNPNCRKCGTSALRVIDGFFQLAAHLQTANSAAKHPTSGELTMPSSRRPPLQVALLGPVSQRPRSGRLSQRGRMLQWPSQQLTCLPNGQRGGHRLNSEGERALLADPTRTCRDRQVGLGTRPSSRSRSMSSSMS
jgi:hypothetical protein